MPRLRVLGRFELRDDDRERTPRPGKSAELLKLVACRGRRMHWEELVDVLWPDAEPLPGRTLLRNVLSRLRAAAGPVLVREGDVIVLPDTVELDVEQFETLALRCLALLPHDRPQALRLAAEAIEHYGGELLPQDRYTTWTVPVRERLRRRFHTLVELQLAELRAQGRREDALALAERVLDLEPQVEEAYTTVATLLEELGRRSEALRTVLRGLQMLGEFGLPPSEALLGAARRLDASPPTGRR